MFKSAKFCSMCGPKFCSMCITQVIRVLTAKGTLLPTAGRSPARRGSCET